MSWNPAAAPPKRKRPTLNTVLPHDLNAELNLLGSLLYSTEYLIEIEGFLEAKDFYSKSNEHIYSCILELYKDEKAVDPLIVKNALEDRHMLQKIGGEQYLGTLTGEVFSSAHAIEYAKIVKNCAIKVEFINANNSSLVEMQDEHWKQGESIQKSIDRLEGIKEKTFKEKKAYDVKTLLSGIIENIMTPVKTESVLTGFRDLDAYNVLNSKELTMLAGRPSMGKTALALNIMERVSRDGKEVLFFSLEMSEDEMLVRQISSLAEINGDRLKGGAHFSATEHASITEAGYFITDQKIYINDFSGISISEIRQAILKRNRELKKTGQSLGLVVLDYIQIINWSKKDFNSKENAMAYYSGALKAMAKRFNIPFLVLAQLNRDVEKRQDMRPKLSDLRDSGSLEQDADVVLMLWREDYGTSAGKRGDIPSPAHIIISKNRNGSTGDVPLDYFRWRHKFQDSWRKNTEEYHV